MLASLEPEKLASSLMVWWTTFSGLSRTYFAAEAKARGSALMLALSLGSNVVSPFARMGTRTMRAAPAWQWRRGRYITAPICQGTNSASP